jgi:hypothetical protein
MTSRIVVYFEDVERSVLESGAVSDYTVLRHEVTSTDGKMRLRAQLRDGGVLELFEYVILDAQEQIVRLKYSYHWQSADGHLVRRWDAVHHHPELAYAPHHVHLSSGSVEGVAEPPSIAGVLLEISAPKQK